MRYPVRRIFTVAVLMGLLTGLGSLARADIPRTRGYQRDGGWTRRSRRRSMSFGPPCRVREKDGFLCVTESKSCEQVNGLRSIDEKLQ
jgi:hypothetical protein